MEIRLEQKENSNTFLAKGLIPFNRLSIVTINDTTNDWY